MRDLPCAVYPDDWHSPDTDVLDAAAWVCNTACKPEVRAACLRAALHYEKGKTAVGRHGIWGGKWPEERARMRSFT